MFNKGLIVATVLLAVLAGWVDLGMAEPILPTLYRDANLCSHIWSICYLAQSIYANQEPHAEPCSRRCPSGLRRISRSQAQYNVRNAIPMGMHTPMSAFGSYCLKDNTTPFCPTSEQDIGDPRCCLADAAEEVTDNSLRLFRRLVQDF